MSASTSAQDVWSNASVDEVYSLFKGIEQRTLLRLHTFDLDKRDIDSWVPKLIRWREGNVPLLRRYAEAYVNPDDKRFLDVAARGADALRQLDSNKGPKLAETVEDTYAKSAHDLGGRSSSGRTLDLCVSAVKPSTSTEKTTTP